MRCIGVERYAEYFEAGADVIPRLAALGAALPTPAAQAHPRSGSKRLLQPGLLRQAIDPVRAQLLHPGFVDGGRYGALAGLRAAGERPVGFLQPCARYLNEPEGPGLHSANEVCGQAPRTHAEGMETSPFRDVGRPEHAWVCYNNSTRARSRKRTPKLILPRSPEPAHLARDPFFRFRVEGQPVRFEEGPTQIAKQRYLGL